MLHVSRPIAGCKASINNAALRSRSFKFPTWGSTFVCALVVCANKVTVQVEIGGARYH